MLKLEISYRGILAIVLGLFAIWSVIQLWSVLLLVLVALILMIGLLPYVEALVRLGLPRGVAVAILLVLILATIVTIVGLVAPALVDEVSSVKENLPESAREVEELLATFDIHVELQDRARNIDWNDLLSGRVAVDLGQRALSTTLSIITIVVMTAYLLADTPRMAGFIGQFIPNDRKDEANRLFFSLTRVVGGYLRGQLITSVCIGVFTFALLSIVGVPNPLAFAVLAAFADIIPLVGALIATVPPAAAALQESSTQALVVLVALVGYQQFEDRFLAPRVYSRTLNLPPLIVLIAVLCGGELLGITGVLLALPLAATGRVAIDYFIEHRRLPIVVDQPFAPDPEPETAEEPKRKPRPRRRRSVSKAGTGSGSSRGA
ncbi:MAG TPA: AI-2E family transporter [Dehalococcoidia bacterium]|nr:AI-2E family transporter [Dehalococcoidia bacterium]